MLDGVVDEQVGDREWRDLDCLVHAAVVVVHGADTFVEPADVPAALVVVQAQCLGIARCAGNPLAVAELGGAVGGVGVQAETGAEDDVTFSLDALGGGAAVGEESGIAGVVGKGRVGVIELDMVSVDIEGEAVGFPDRADLEGLALDR